MPQHPEYTNESPHIPDGNIDFLIKLIGLDFANVNGNSHHLHRGEFLSTKILSKGQIFFSSGSISGGSLSYIFSNPGGNGSDTATFRAVLIAVAHFKTVETPI